MQTTKNVQLEKTRRFLQKSNDEIIIPKTAEFLSEELNVDNVIIGHLISNGTRIRTITFYSMGKDLGELEYNLEFTPCENIINRKACYYPRNIIHLFPKDQELKDLKAESYLGTPIVDERGEAVGLIALIHSKPIGNAEDLTKILEEVAERLRPVVQKRLKETIGH